MAKIGRPTKLTPAVQEAILTAIEYGMPLSHAAAYGGVDADTVLNWRKAGEALQTRLDAGEALQLDSTEQRYVAFFGAIQQSFAKAMLFHLQNLTDSAHVNPGNSMWILERRWPDIFGRPTQKLEHTGPDGGPLAFRDDTLLGLSDDDLRRNLAALGRVAALVALESGEPGDGDADGLAGADSTGEKE